MLKNIFKGKKYTEALKILIVLELFFSIIAGAILILMKYTENFMLPIIAMTIGFLIIALEEKVKISFSQWCIFKNHMRVVAIFVIASISVIMTMAEKGIYLSYAGSEYVLSTTVLVGITVLTIDNIYVLIRSLRINIDDYKTEEQIEKDYPSLYSQENAWHHKVTGNEGDVILFGVNIFEYNWEDTCEKVRIFSLKDNEEYTFNAYRVYIDGISHKFVAGQFSSGYWGFYTQ